MIFSIDRSIDRYYIILLCLDRWPYHSQSACYGPVLGPHLIREVSFNPLSAIDANLRQTCVEAMCKGLKLADSLFSEGKWREVAGGWALKMASLRLDTFYDSFFTLNLTVQDW